MQTTHYVDPTLLSKYNTNGPRYTSYPTALSFDDSYYNDDLLHAVRTSPNQDLSLYIHIPFCHSLCFYCACNKIVTRHAHKADEYLEYLADEITTRQAMFKRYTVKQLHLGGGTPSFLSGAQLSKLMDLLRSNFSFDAECEMSIEIDPRNIELNFADQLQKLGFNRMSIGVQDIDADVQRAINRVQPTEFVKAFIDRAKSVGFRSVNVDLIYGLPLQTPVTFARTLDTVKAINVDRISLFSYAHLPSRFAAQRKIKDEWLPSIQNKLALMNQAIESLTGAGYEFIGMDHFAKPNDELAIAKQNRTLHRNFQGYTTKGNCDLLGLGVSAISAIGNHYSQNHKQLKDYYHCITDSGHAVEKGTKLNLDDQIRAYIIRELMCNLYVDKQKVEQRFDIVFEQYFGDYHLRLHPFIEDNLLQNDTHQIKIAEHARLLVRNICMVFDAYLNQQIRQRYSNVI